MYNSGKYFCKKAQRGRKGKTISEVWETRIWSLCPWWCYLHFTSMHFYWAFQIPFGIVNHGWLSLQAVSAASQCGSGAWHNPPTASCWNFFPSEHVPQVIPLPTCESLDERNTIKLSLLFVFLFFAQNHDLPLLDSLSNLKIFHGWRSLSWWQTINGNTLK